MECHSSAIVMNENFSVEVLLSTVAPKKDFFLWVLLGVGEDRA